MSDTMKTSAVGDVLDNIRDLAQRQGSDEVSVGDLAEAIGGRGFGPLIFITALFEITPLGVIPGVPTFLAMICAVFALQLLAGRTHAWLPGFVENRKLRAPRVCKAVDALRGIAGWMDRHFGQRLDPLAGHVAARVAGALILCLCLTVPPLELLPWVSSAPMLAIALLGLAMTVRDGLLMLIAFVGSGTAAITVYFALIAGG
ncbi:exopolysaccharide biosynthesis protein [Roseovarius sp. D0-M9]|uniref:exopolysaccharide biosynthesis protein n=1 Tax=Roseovarius sp. D0-M9 TaxID=3127117 RepID=UPI00300F88BA